MAPKYLFPEDLVPTDIKLADGYSFRPLERSDFSKGHLDPLTDLAYLGDITEQSWTERFDFMAVRDGTYYILVITKDDKIVGTGTLMVEKKL
jgi:glucosamine-phosphate N-acetyltransferase